MAFQAPMGAQSATLPFGLHGSLKQTPERFPLPCFRRWPDDLCAGYESTWWMLEEH